jgi:hypothetical protein
MNDTLFQALAQLDLQPGQRRRVQLNGCAYEICRLAAENSDLVDMVMLEPWVNFPDPSPVARLQVRRGTLPLPDPPVIPSDEEDES